MKFVGGFGLFMVLFSILSFSGAAHAGCVGTEDLGETPCTGSGRCRGSYDLQICSFGCIQESANPMEGAAFAAERSTIPPRYTPTTRTTAAARTAEKLAVILQNHT